MFNVRIHWISCARKQKTPRTPQKTIDLHPAQRPRSTDGDAIARTQMYRAGRASRGRADDAITDPA